MFINWALQEINLKIVFYGPGMSGKTTNLEYIHSKLDPSLAGELVSLKTKIQSVYGSWSGILCLQP